MVYFDALCIAAAGPSSQLCLKDGPICLLRRYAAPRVAALFSKEKNRIEWSEAVQRRQFLHFLKSRIDSPRRQ